MSDQADFNALQKLRPAEALAYLQRRQKLTVTYSATDLWQAEHAHQFTISRLTQLDLLGAIQSSITKSVGGDLSRRDWTRDTRALLQQAGWWGTNTVTDLNGQELKTRFDNARLKLIYDTNTRQAHAAGLWERAQRNKATEPYIRYITKRDEKVREAHQAWDNVTLPIDHPFWKTHKPPLGYRCRCRYTTVSQREYDEGNKPDGGPMNKVAPEIVMRDWLDKRTGEIKQVPVGIDPGFDYNVGEASLRAEQLQQLVKAKLAGAPPALASAAEAAGLMPPKAAMASPVEIQALIDGRAVQPLSVAQLPADIALQLDARTFEVLLSRQTALKQATHPEITPESYALLNDLLKEGERVYDRARHVIVIWRKDQPYVAVLKVTANGQYVFLQSFRRSDQKNIESLLKRNAGES